jgi:hypothetical protein
MIGPSVAVRSYLLHSFLQVNSAAIAAFYEPRRQVQLCGAKSIFFPESNQQHTFGFSSSKFTVQDHILSTIGECLYNTKLTQKKQNKTLELHRVFVHRALVDAGSLWPGNSGTHNTHSSPWSKFM